MSELQTLKTGLNKLSSPAKAKASAWFFKTGPGQYGEGDVFIGVTMPEQRLLAKQFTSLSLAELDKLISSPIHEERSVALIILVRQFRHGDEAIRRLIYNFYMSHLQFVNNWDLVDGSAEFIVGAWLQNRSKSILIKLAKSPNIWRRRIAMMATFHYIKQGDPTEAFKIAELLLTDKHDLIQKVVGWMLREIGKRCSREAEQAFLRQHYQELSRTTLRYAIEHFTLELRQAYLKGNFA